ncbi:hypothetical protein [Paenibacillus sp. TH7-28]
MGSLTAKVHFNRSKMVIGGKLDALLQLIPSSLHLPAKNEQLLDLICEDAAKRIKVFFFWGGRQINTHCPDALNDYPV